MEFKIYKDAKIIMPEIGESILSDNGTSYQVVRIVNIGKNGAVFLVKRESDSKTYALKIQYNLLPKRLNRFNREVEFLKSHDKSWLLSYCDSGKIVFSGKKFPFVITPYYPYNLEEYLFLNNTSYENKLSIACSLLMALTYLGEIGFVHRDIKPQNILTDGSHVVLADFGLIKKVSDFSVSVERTDILEASASMPRHYRTPELVDYAKGEIDIVPVLSDVFQAGLVLSWMFTGLNPLISSEDKLSEIKMNGIPLFNGKMSSEVHQAIVEMLCLNPQERSPASKSLSTFLHIYENVHERQREVE